MFCDEKLDQMLFFFLHSGVVGSEDGLRVFGSGLVTPLGSGYSMDISLSVIVGAIAHFLVV